MRKKKRLHNTKVVRQSKGCAVLFGSTSILVTKNENVRKLSWQNSGNSCKTGTPKIWTWTRISRRSHPKWKRQTGVMRPGRESHGHMTKMRISKHRSPEFQSKKESKVYLVARWVSDKEALCEPPWRQETAMWGDSVRLERSSVERIVRLAKIPVGRGTARSWDETQGQEPIDLQNEKSASTEVFFFFEKKKDKIPRHYIRQRLKVQNIGKKSGTSRMWAIQVGSMTTSFAKFGPFLRAHTLKGLERTRSEASRYSCGKLRTREWRSLRAGLVGSFAQKVHLKMRQDPCPFWSRWRRLCVQEKCMTNSLDGVSKGKNRALLSSVNEAGSLPFAEHDRNVKNRKCAMGADCGWSSEYCVNVLFVVLLSGDVWTVRGGSSALNAPLPVCLSINDSDVSLVKRKSTTILFSPNTIHWLSCFSLRTRIIFTIFSFRTQITNNDVFSSTTSHRYNVFFSNTNH